jgi:MtrB/PioB family decaheme-associated outer membrane protein
MKTPGQHGLKRYTLMLPLVFLCCAAGAQQVNVQDRACRRCPSGDGWELDVKGGPAYVTDDAYNFGDYTGLDEDGGYLFGDVFGRYRGEDSSYATFEGFTRNSDSSAFFLKGGKQSVYELRASYQAIPRRIFNTAATPYDSNGSNSRVLPPDWVRAPTTQLMTALDGALSPAKVEWDLDIYRFGFDLKPARQWKLRADYTRREREGQNRASGSFLFDAAEFTTPIDYATDDFEVALTYAADRWQTSLTYFGSLFSNDNDSLTWDNAFTAAPGSDTGQLAQPPDNESHQVSLAGSMLLPARTTLNGQLSLGRLSQDESLLPYTTNSFLVTNPLPVNVTDAAVDTMNVNIRAVSTPWSKVTLEGEYRYNDFDNDTPVNLYDYVITDTLPAADAASSRAYDYERQEIKLRSEFRISAAVQAQIGFDNERFERERQDRSRTTTNRLWVQFRTRPVDGVTLNVDLFADDRDGSGYNTVENPAAPENPLMRKYNMADREREGVKFRGSVYRWQHVDLGFEFEYSKDKYDNSQVGLTESESVRFGTDLTWLLPDNASAYASLYNEDVQTDQSNSQSFSLPDWAATSDDRFTTAALGLVYPEIISRLDASFEYNWSNSVGETNNWTNGLPGSFPDLRSKRQNIRVGLSYPYSKSLTFGLDYFFESLDSDDWYLEGVQPDTIRNLLALGVEPWDYDTSVIYFSVRYRLRK